MSSEPFNQSVSKLRRDIGHILLIEVILCVFCVRFDCILVYLSCLKAVSVAISIEPIEWKSNLVSNIPDDARIARRWLGGSRYEPVCQNGRCNTDPKYGVMHHSFYLSVYDVDCNSTCTVENVRNSLKLNFEDVVYLKAKDEESQITRLGTVASNSLVYKKIYPSPDCFVSFRGESVNKSVKVDPTQFRIMYGTEIYDKSSLHLCRGNLMLECALCNHKINATDEQINTCEDLKAKDEESQITRLGTVASNSLVYKKIYQSPDCFVSFRGESVSKSVKVDPTQFRIMYGTEIYDKSSLHSCRGNLMLECALCNHKINATDEKINTCEETTPNIILLYLFLSCLVCVKKRKRNGNGLYQIKKNLSVTTHIYVIPHKGHDIQLKPYTILMASLILHPVCCLSATVSWELVSPAVFGSATHLLCNISDNANSCSRSRRQWLGGPYNKPLCQDDTCRDVSKYDVMLDPSDMCSYALTIYNLSVFDVECDYTCSYGVENMRKRLKLSEMEFIYVPMKEDIESQITSLGTVVNYKLVIKKIYPSPRCSVSYEGVNVSKSTKFFTTKSGLLFATEIQVKSSLPSCSGNLLVECLLGNRTINVPEKINTCAAQSSISVWILGTVLTSVAIVVLALVCIVIWLRRGKYTTHSRVKCGDISDN